MKHSATHVPDEQTSPLPQLVPSGWFAGCSTGSCADPSVLVVVVVILVVVVIVVVGRGRSGSSAPSRGG
jgi:hypothetical protein